MNEIQFRQLVENYITGKLSEAAQKQFFELLEIEKYRKIFELCLSEDWNEGKYEQPEYADAYSQIEQNVLRRINEISDKEGKKKALVLSMKKFRLVAAAVLLFLLTGTAIMFFQRKNQESIPTAATQPPVQNVEIGPATNGAILTLDDGQQIVLDSIGNGIVAAQGNSKIIKSQEGLSYQTVNLPGDAIIYNTIFTPKGKQYPNLILSDGTRVWLDAGSSIRFPVVFTGMERKVEITGQAWFDVVHNDRLPFKVIAKNVEVVDLGTQFNVKAYSDENSIKVTLLQGAISIKNTLMKPGEQAEVSGDGTMGIHRNIDLEEVTAWKDGFFKFNDADVPTVLRELSRWYDVDVTYSGTVSKETYDGKIGRNLTLKEALEGLAFTHVNFKIEGRKLIVLP